MRIVENMTTAFSLYGGCMLIEVPGIILHVSCLGGSVSEGALHPRSKSLPSYDVCSNSLSTTRYVLNRYPGPNRLRDQFQ